MDRRELLAYALPVLPIYFLWSPIVILQGIYAKYFGLQLTTIAGIILIARLCDAFSDPIVGYLSDRHVQNGGGRKIFVIIGGAFLILSSWFLYVPYAGEPRYDEISVSTISDVSSLYFFFWLLTFYISYTLFEIPHLAWGSRLGSSSVDNTKIFSFRALFVILGSLLFFSVPLMPVFDTSEITPQTLRWSVLIAGTLMIPSMFLCVSFVSDVGIQDSEKSSFLQTNAQGLIGHRFKSIFRNNPLTFLSSPFFLVVPE